MSASGLGSETFILFQIADTTYAASSQSVRQMEMIEHITPLPNAPEFVDGIVFTRGQVIPAINLRVRFGCERAAPTVRSRLIVVGQSGRQVGLIVDSAREFISIPADAIQPPPEAISGLSGRYLRGIVTMNERIVLVLNLDEVIRLENQAAAISAGTAEPRSGGI